MKAIYFDCFVGASGDMILGVLADLGLDMANLAERLRLLPLEGYRLQSQRVCKRGITATKVNIVLDAPQSGGGHGRHYREIVDMIEGSNLSARVKEQSLAVFALLGSAEAKIHGQPLDEVEFHEVGAVDSIVDVVGSAVGLEMLGVEQVHSSPLPLSRGVVGSQHGLLPVPAPATLEVLRGIPTRGIDIDGETLTPTGAAILAGLSRSFGLMPPMILERIGYGAGTRDWPDLPNVLRACLGELQPPAAASREVIHLLEANVDDMTPELLAHAMERLLQAGAVDAWLTPIVMKKGRPAAKLSALAHADRLAAVVDAFLRETTTFGVRMTEWHRHILQRESVEVETPFGKVRVKAGRLGDKIVTVTPEYEDCRRVAEQKGVPLRQVYAAAQRAAGTS